MIADLSYSNVFPNLVFAGGLDGGRVRGFSSKIKIVDLAWR